MKTTLITQLDLASLRVVSTTTWGFGMHVTALSLGLNKVASRLGLHVVASSLRLHAAALPWYRAVVVLPIYQCWLAASCTGRVTSGSTAINLTLPSIRCTT